MKEREREKMSAHKIHNTIGNDDDDDDDDVTRFSNAEMENTMEKY